LTCHDHGPLLFHDRFRKLLAKPDYGIMAPSAEEAQRLRDLFGMDLETNLRRDQQGQRQGTTPDFTYVLFRDQESSGREDLLARVGLHGDSWGTLLPHLANNGNAEWLLWDMDPEFRVSRPCIEALLPDLLAVLDAKAAMLVRDP
jgi:hypothetical protein